MFLKRANLRSDNELMGSLRAFISTSTGILLIAGALIALDPAPATAVSENTISGTGQVYAGSYESGFWTADRYDSLASWAGKRETFGGTFHDVLESDPSVCQSPSLCNWEGNTDHLLEEVWRGKATPFANLTINASAHAIASGEWDAKIVAWLGKVDGWLDRGGNRSMILAPLQEANGDWTPYGHDPTNFKLAYRRIVDMARGMGLDETKVRWAWAPNGWSTPPYRLADYYPGDGYVDVVGISAYNFGTGIDTWTGVYATMAGAIDELRTFVPHKPYFLAQTASSSSGGDKSQWTRDFFAYAASDANIVGFVWFNIDKETDWAVFNSGTRMVQGYKDGMQFASTKYKWPLTDWFKPGPLPFAPGGDLSGPCPTGKDCHTASFVDSGSRFFLWQELAIGSPQTAFYFGNPGDVAFSGDWDCDGEATVGMYRQSDGYVYLRNSNTQGVADIRFFFGIPGDFPVAGDFDGDGCDTVSIYRGSEARFYIMNELGKNDGGLGAAEHAFYFGNVGDKPFVGDFDGDGVDTVGLHRESTGFVYFRNSNTTGIAEHEFFFGDPGDVLVAGDWDGDGDDSVAVYRRSNGMFFVKNTNSQGVADNAVYVGDFVTVVRGPLT